MGIAEISQLTTEDLREQYKIPAEGDRILIIRICKELCEKKSMLWFVSTCSYSITYVYKFINIIAISWVVDEPERSVSELVAKFLKRKDSKDDVSSLCESRVRNINNSQSLCTNNQCYIWYMWFHLHLFTRNPERSSPQGGQPLIG